ncbi:hypothetical protein F5Y11DRAFT_315833 [Daldinia sp. FL1419]|nr:hypothetical protein F5Y11DRAFT_315833 [Daldinia sp. FL1419]
MHLVKMTMAVLATSAPASAGLITYAACQSACASATLWIPGLGVPAYATCQSYCAWALISPTP